MPVARLAGVAFVALLTACSGARYGSILWQLESPDASRVVYLVRSGGSFGPTDDFNYFVIVRSTTDPYSPSQRDRGTVWSSESLAPAYIFWRTNEELEILVPPDQGHLDTLAAKPLPSLRVTSRLLLRRNQLWPEAVGQFPTTPVSTTGELPGGGWVDMSGW